MRRFIIRIDRVFHELGLLVLERGWLSSNNVVFRSRDGAPATVVDTGYDSHSAQTVELVARAAGAAGVGQVVNTHLHSDHCGGNHALQSRWDAETLIPASSWDAVASWDADALTFELTGQTCQRFRADGAVSAGEEVRLGDHAWRALAAPGHDPDALMYFHRGSRVLISGDALWESRLAIIFPELQGRSGYAEAAQVLDLIQELDPHVVIPGHGAPFVDVAGALAASRRRLAQFRSAPEKHARSAARSLAMFRMLELRRVQRADLEAWLVQAEIFREASRGKPQRADLIVDSLLVDGLVVQDAAGILCVATGP